MRLEQFSLYRPLSAEQRRLILQRASEESGLSTNFVILMAAATAIATAGLLADSTPVVIAAMLVAPLMSPLLGFSLATVQGDWRLGAMAARTVAAGVAICILGSILIHRLLPPLELGNEVFNRTKPNFLDLLVAVAAGFTGAYSLVRPEIGGVLPGVAIGVALVPPLCTVGIEISIRDQAGAAGAFLLFVANVIAIHVSGAVVFTFKGFSELQGAASFKAWLRKQAPGLLLFALVTAVLANELVKMAEEQRIHRVIRDVLSTQAKMIAGASLDRYTVARHGKRIMVRAVMRTPFSFDPARVQSIQRVLASGLGSDVELVIRSVLAKDATASAYLTHEAEQPSGSKPTDVLAKLDEILRMQAYAVPGAVLDKWELVSRNGKKVLIVGYKTPSPFDRDLVRGIRNIVLTVMGPDVEVEIQSTVPDQP